MNSIIAMATLWPPELKRLTPIAVRTILFATLLSFSPGITPAQIQPSQLVDTRTPTQQSVSVNQLLTPEKARRATEKARQEVVRGHFESALAEAGRALEIFPRCAIALSIQGSVHLSRANYAEAGHSFQQAIDADPGLGIAYLGLGMALTSQGRFNDALIPLDRAAAFLPSSWMVHFEAALAHLGVGEPEAALSEIRYAERFMGGDAQKRAGVSYLRGVANIELKDMGEAKADLNESLKRDPNGIYAVLARARLDQIDSSGDNQQIAHSTVEHPF
jgi:tetratricopeptide (TPR) repeat protein